MSDATNFNHLHKLGPFISSTDGQITVGDVRNAIAHLPDDAEIHLGVCDCGCILELSGFKDRGGAISFNTRCVEFG